MNAQVQWFCSLAIDEGVLTPELCRELFSRVGDNAEFAEYLPEKTYFGADDSAASAVAEEEDNRST